MLFGNGHFEAKFHRTQSSGLQMSLSSWLEAVGQEMVSGCTVIYK